jgi:NAD(P)-dependent dehydrogenase (short-subunit alcohol dehydrogenase family)
MHQRVLITAAAAGIGRSIAAAFIGNGARVHICDVDASALASFRTEFPGAVATRVDLCDGAAIDAWVDAAVADLGGVDVLVNNAGTKGPTAFIEDIEPQEWDQCLSVSLDSHFRCTRRVAGLLKAQRSGCVINVSSMAGVFGFGMRTPYAAAKWAIVGLTKSLAIEFGPHDVRCNCICPGTVRGDRMDRVIAAEAQLRGITPEQVTAEYLSGQSIKRFVEASEIADLALFLASPAARMINGQAIGVDGNTETYHI